jgi:signal transduction histidine kinase/CheY-like chemotaxis protein
VKTPPDPYKVERCGTSGPIDGMDDAEREHGAGDGPQAVPAEAESEARLRHELAERTRHLEAVLGNIAQGIIILDPDLRVVLTNDGLHDLVGYPRALGKPGTHVEALIRDRLEHGLYLPGEKEQGLDVDEIVAYRLQAYRDLKRESYRHPFPNDRLVEINREKLADGSIVCTFTDVTDQVKAEEEMARQRRALYEQEKLSALGMLLAGIAHELNNPLSVVLGQTSLIEETASDPKLRERAARVRTAAERCAKVVKTFLAIARESPPERTNLSLNALVEQGLELVGYQLRRNQVEVESVLTPDLPEAVGDPAQIGQVVINLLINACQAMEKVAGARRLDIRTSASRGGGEVELEITDTGPGIPAPLKSRIFDPFFTTKPVGTGTGIGLAFSHGVVTAHGGTISVDEAEGGGARFVIRLPRLHGALAGPDQSDPDPRTTPAARVLVVDDEPGIGEIVVDFLRSGGLEAEAVTSGEDALDRLENGTFDAVICDLRMPGLDGSALYHEVGRRRPELLERFIFATGDQFSETTRRFLMASGRPCLDKPLLPEQVLRIVTSVLNLKRTPPARLTAPGPAGRGRTGRG